MAHIGMAIHTTEEDRKVCTSKAYGKDSGKCVGFSVGNSEVTIFHSGDTLFLQRLRSQLNMALDTAIRSKTATKTF